VGFHFSTHCAAFTGSMHAPQIFAVRLRRGFPHFEQGGPYIDNW